MHLKKYISGIFVATALCVGVTANAAVTSVQPDKNIGVYTSDQAVSFIITRNDTEAGSLTYTIEDVDKTVKRNGTISFSANETQKTVKYGNFIPGWYRVNIGGSDIFASFTVVEKMTGKPDSSPFSTMLHGFSGMDTSKIPAYAEALSVIGFDTVRDATSWTYNTATSIDVVVNPLKQNGLNTLLSYGIPKEAATNNPERLITGNLYYTSEMLKTQSSNYKGKVAAYEIINEPDLNSRHSSKPYSADVFSSYYKAAALAIEAGNPDALKSFGGLAEASTGFGEIMMQNGVADYTDSLNVHLHNSANSKSTITFKSPRIEKLNDWRAIYGNNQPLWNTEAGLNSPIDANTGVLKEDQLKLQAKYAITSAVQSIANYGTENHFWFIIRHYLENGANYGTTAPNHCTYPAFYSLAMLTRGLGEGKPIGELLGASQDVSGYFFDTGANDAVVLWNNGSGTSYQQLKTSKPVVVKNLIGGTELKYGTTSKDVVNIPVSYEPVIVIFDGRSDEDNYISKSFESSYVRDITRTVGEKVILQAIWGNTDLEVLDGRYVLTPGETYNITLNVYNFNNEAISGNINLMVDDGVEIVGAATKSFTDSALNYNSKQAVSLNYTIKVKPDAENQHKGSFSFSGTANGSSVSETVCGYVVEHGLTRESISSRGTITTFSKNTFSSKIWKDGNKTSGASTRLSATNNSTSTTFTATIKSGDSRFWFPKLNRDLSALANSDGFIFDINVEKTGENTEMIMYANISSGAYSVMLGKFEEGKNTIVVPWTKFYPYNGDVPDKLDTTQLTEISLGFRTRGSSEVKYVISDTGYYKFNDSVEETEEFVTLSGITNNGTYVEGSRYNKLTIDGKFDNIYLNNEKVNKYTDLGDGAIVDFTGLEPGSYSLIVTKNRGFGKIDYKKISFCIKAIDDYTPYAISRY